VVERISDLLEIVDVGSGFSEEKLDGSSFTRLE
jgi:hypothetical protein